MDLRQLHYFSVLAETLNFHRAAERLHISQPPLTVAIRKLEADLGASLFLRSSRGVSLTAAGQAALAPARETLAQAEAVRRAVWQGVKGEVGRLALGFVGSATFDLLPRLIASFRARYPRIELVLEEGTSVNICERIETGALDIGLVRLPVLGHVNLDTHVVELDDMVVALPGSHPLARRDCLRIEDMVDEPFVVHGPISVLRSTVMFACQNAGFLPRIAQEAIQVQTILSLVQSGLGVALVPARSRRFIPEGVVLMPLEQPIAIELGVVHARRANAIVANFISVAREAGDIH